MIPNLDERLTYFHSTLSYHHFTAGYVSFTLEEKNKSGTMIVLTESTYPTIFFPSIDTFANATNYFRTDPSASTPSRKCADHLVITYTQNHANDCDGILHIIEMKKTIQSGSLPQETEEQFLGGLQHGLAIGGVLGIHLTKVIAYLLCHNDTFKVNFTPKHVPVGMPLVPSVQVTDVQLPLWSKPIALKVVKVAELPFQLYDDTQPHAILLAFLPVATTP